MKAKSKNIKSDLKKVDAHTIQADEYEELPELTDEMFARAVYKVGGVETLKACHASERWYPGGRALTLDTSLIVKAFSKIRS